MLGISGRPDKTGHLGTFGRETRGDSSSFVPQMLRFCPLLSRSCHTRTGWGQGVTSRKKFLSHSVVFRRIRTGMRVGRYVLTLCYRKDTARGKGQVSLNWGSGIWMPEGPCAIDPGPVGGCIPQTSWIYRGRGIAPAEE